MGCSNPNMSASWYALVTLISRGFFVGRVLNVLDHLQCLQSGRHDDAQTLIAALPFGNWGGIVLRPVLHGAAAQATGIGGIMVDKDWTELGGCQQTVGVTGFGGRCAAKKRSAASASDQPLSNLRYGAYKSKGVLVNMSRIMLTLSGTPSANVQVAVQSSVDVGAYVPASSIVGRHVRATIELAGLSCYVGQGERASFSSDGPAGR